MKLKERISLFRKSTYENVLVLLSLALVGFHTWQYIKSGFCVDCLIRICIYSCTAITTFFFGIKYLYLVMIVFAFCTEYRNSFENYTSLFIILLSVRENRSIEKIVLPLYIIASCSSLMFQHLEISHIVIHLLTMTFLYAVYFLITRKEPVKSDFYVNEREIIILDQLAEGKLLKQIEDFDKNQKTYILREAMERNNCTTKEELLMKYLYFYKNKLPT